MHVEGVVGEIGPEVLVAADPCWRPSWTPCWRRRRGQLAEIIICLQGTCAGSDEIQGKHGEEEEGALAHTLNGSLMGNQSRQGDSGAGDGRWPCQNNTGRSPVAALDSQDRQIPGGSAAGQTQGSLLAAGPDDMVGLDPHQPRIGHQVDSLLLGCNQAAAA